MKYRYITPKGKTAADMPLLCESLCWGNSSNLQTRIAINIQFILLANKSSQFVIGEGFLKFKTMCVCVCLALCACVSVMMPNIAK